MRSLFVPWLAVRPRRLAFAAMLAGVAVALLVPALRYGWASNLRLLGDWWTTVRTSTAPNLLNQDNVSLAAMFTKWLGPDSAAPTLALFATVLLLVLTAIVIAGARGLLRLPEPLEAALLLTLIPLISPQGWDYVFLIATPAVMLIVDNLQAAARGNAPRDHRGNRHRRAEHLRSDGAGCLRDLHGQLGDHAVFSRRNRGAGHAAGPTSGVAARTTRISSCGWLFY